jgi:two-component system chemotaxis sensor kinase CheA
MFDFFRNKSSQQATSTVTPDSKVVYLSPEDVAENIIRELGSSSNTMEKYAAGLLSKIAGEKEILQGLFLIYDGKSTLTWLAGYAYNKETYGELTFGLGEGLPGQVARDRKLINLKNVPNGYITIRTGLGQASPDSLILFPVCHQDTLIGVVELASFRKFTAEDEKFYTLLSEKAGEEMTRIKQKEKKKNA